MGEQVGQSLELGLSFVSKNEFDQAKAITDKYQRARYFAQLSRINTLYMIARAGSGHIGSSFSSMDILSWLHLETLTKEDTFFSSKGHDAPGYYALMIALGHLPFEKIHQLRRLNGLPGHPDVSVPVCKTNTGSLGMGISKAKGMLFARKLRQQAGKVYVLLGDGELQEGQVWESLVSAANHKLADLVVIVDHNKIQSDTFVKATSDLGDIEAKFRSFGWHVARCDGHDFLALERVLTEFGALLDKPKVVIADTIKGRGVSFMEHTALDSDVAMYQFHSGAPAHEVYQKALSELVSTVPKVQLTRDEVAVKKLVEAQYPPQRLVKAYSAALLEQALKNDNIVALDADLILDTGLIPFRETLPERFVECGIAEQDMVSQAGGMALEGLLPIVHSFSCFLTARANEQIYNNATERTKIIYVGSLTGVVPAGPGHSHQAVRDIASLRAIPDFLLFEPSCEKEVALGLDFLLNSTPCSSYMRLVSIPCEIPFELPADYRLSLGRGIELIPGNEVVIIGSGPVLLAQAWLAAQQLKQQGINVKLINLPWFNFVDSDWLRRTVQDVSLLITLDNHQISGGQGEFLAAKLVELNVALPVEHIGLNGIPLSGANNEVLAAHKMNASAITTAVLNILNKVKCTS